MVSSKILKLPKKWSKYLPVLIAIILIILTGVTVFVLQQQQETRSRAVISETGGESAGSCTVYTPGSGQGDCDSGQTCVVPPGGFCAPLRGSPYVTNQQICYGKCKDIGPRCSAIAKLCNNFISDRNCMETQGLHSIKVSCLNSSGNKISKSCCISKATLKAINTTVGGVAGEIGKTFCPLLKKGKCQKSTVHCSGQSLKNYCGKGVNCCVPKSTIVTTDKSSDPSNPSTQTISVDNSPSSESTDSADSVVSNTSSTSSSTVLSLDLLMHGIGKAGDSLKPGAAGGGNMDPETPEREVKVNIFDNQDQNVKSVTAKVKFDSVSGSFKGQADLGDSFAGGQYLVKVKFTQSLNTQIGQIQTITKGATKNLPQTSFVTGDINDDGAISLNVLDFNTLLDCISGKSCDEDQKLQSDLDDNGKVDVFDFNLFMREITSLSG